MFVWFFFLNLLMIFLVSFRFVSALYCFVSVVSRFVSFLLVSFRFVSFLFRFLFYNHPYRIKVIPEMRRVHLF